MKTSYSCILAVTLTFVLGCTKAQPPSAIQADNPEMAESLYQQTVERVAKEARLPAQDNGFLSLAPLCVAKFWDSRSPNLVSFCALKSRVGLSAQEQLKNFREHPQQAGQDVARFESQLPRLLAANGKPRCNYTFDLKSNLFTDGVPEHTLRFLRIMLQGLQTAGLYHQWKGERQIACDRYLLALELSNKWLKTGPFTNRVAAAGCQSGAALLLLQLLGESVMPGVYDVGLDKNGDSQTASCFYGPFDTSSAQQPDLVLHNCAGRPVDQLFGKIWLQPTQAAGNRQVTFRPAIELVDVDTEVPAPVTMNTAADGSFALPLGSNRELGLDVEVYDGAGALDEWIDVGKRNKPCYVEFTTDQSPVENRLRANQSELPPDRPPVANKPFGALGGGSVALIPFTASLPQPGLASLDNGQIPVDKVTRLLADIVLGGTPNDPDNSKLWGVLDYGYIRLDTNGSWWWKYAVNIYADRETKWSFTDATNDTYTLSIFNTNGDPTGSGMHKVSYNSSSPTIKRIQYRL